MYAIRSYYDADGAKALSTPTRKAACAVVFKNPFAGKYEEDLSLLIEFSSYNFV